ncbi:MAG: hypothetical protein A2046_00920 [Bacteroidetes bacterium GWA2_30_7]|nr:MAG: hypothetical protein A2046_00920 [Bacteroidetes bacterium GWA2_30_7]
MLGIINNYDLSDDIVKAALNDKYNVKANYVYRTDRVKYPTNVIYNTGVFNDFSMFDWKNIVANNPEKWIKSIQTIKYSPNGQSLEEKDINNKYSAVKYAYSDILPVITANNARYDNIYFNNFESELIPMNIAHSGSNSLNYTNNPDFKITNTLILDNELIQQGANIRLWLKSTTNNAAPDFKIKLNNNLAEYPFKKVAQTGDWSLFESNIKEWAGLTAGASLDIALDYTLNQGEEVFIDDIRFQPTVAQATCYVYDPLNFRLVAQFNDQHFATFYQYNEEGKLIRIMVETERGLKTVKETQYNIPRKVL